MARPATTPKNFHDSIRNMFTGASSAANSTGSLAYNLEQSANASQELLETQTKHNAVALKIMQEQTKLLKKIAANDNGGIGLGTVVGGALLTRFVERIFGKRMAGLIGGGIGGALATSIVGIGKKAGRMIVGTISTQVGKAFSMVAAAGRAIFAPLAGLKNIITASGAMKAVTTVANGAKLLPRLLGKLFLPLTALMGIADAFSGWGNAESILGKSNASFGDRVSSAIGTAINGLLLGIPDWIVGKLGGGNVSKLLAGGKDLIVSGISYLGTGIGNALKTGIQGLGSLVPSGMTLLSSIGTFVTDSVYGAFEVVKNAIWDGLVYLGTAMKDSVKGVFKDMWGSVKNWWNGTPGSSAPPLTKSSAGTSGLQSTPANYGPGAAFVAGAGLGGGGGGGGGWGGSNTATATSSSAGYVSGGTSGTAAPEVSPVGTPNATGGTGGELGSLVAGAESGKASYNAYNRGTRGGKIIGADRAENLEGMSLKEIMRRQSLPNGHADRLFAVGKYQVIPDTMKEAVQKLGLTGDETYSKDLQERIFRDYLVGSKRPAIRDYITGKTDKIEGAVEGLAYEFASFGGMDGRGKYGSGNKVSVSPHKSAGVLNRMRKTYADAVAAGESPEAAYAKAYGATPNAGGVPASLGEVKMANQNATRNQDIDPYLKNNIRSVVTQAFGEDYKVEVYSGGQSGNRRTGSRRHNDGNAADVRILDPKGNPISDEQAAIVSQLYLAKGHGSVGLRMKGGGLHFDNITKDKLRSGEANIWSYPGTDPRLKSQAALGLRGITPEGLKYSDAEMAALKNLGAVNTANTYYPGDGKGLSGLIGGKRKVTPTSDRLAGDSMVARAHISSPVNPSQKAAVPSFESLMDKKTTTYTPPVVSAQTGGVANDSSGQAPQQMAGNPGGFRVADVPVIDEYKMTLANGSALT